MALQILGLFALNELGHLTADLLELRLPGNLLGMLLLLGLLLTGVFPLRWIELGSTLLVRHLAFFFIPIAVGLMGFGPLLTREGPAMVAALVASTLLGLWVAGGVTQRFMRKRSSDGAERARTVF